MKTTKTQIQNLQSEEERNEKIVRIVSGIITGILSLGFAVYFSRTLFLYITNF